MYVIWFAHNYCKYIGVRSAGKDLFSIIRTYTETQRTVFRNSIQFFIEREWLWAYCFVFACFNTVATCYHPQRYIISSKYFNGMLFTSSMDSLWIAVVATHCEMDDADSWIFTHYWDKFEVIYFILYLLLNGFFFSLWFRDKRIKRKPVPNRFVGAKVK